MYFLCLLYNRDLVLHQPNYIYIYMFKGETIIVKRGRKTTDKISYMILSKVVY